MLSLHDLLFGGIIGYIAGSIPSAYLITRWKTGMDLRREGSRNIGARNAFEVTGDKSIGTFVLVADVLKGLLPVFIFEFSRPGNPATTHPALTVLIPSLVLGHCYPVWLRFHGGRGLATAAGALVLVDPLAIVYWLGMYFISSKLTKQVHFSAIMASGAALLAILIFPPGVLEATTLAISGLSGWGAEFQLSLGVVLLIILSRHIEPFLALMRGKTSG